MTRTKTRIVTTMLIQARDKATTKEVTAKNNFIVIAFLWSGWWHPPFKPSLQPCRKFFHVISARSHEIVVGV